MSRPIITEDAISFLEDCLWGTPTPLLKLGCSDIVTYSKKFWSLNCKWPQHFCLTTDKCFASCHLPKHIIGVNVPKW